METTLGIIEGFYGKLYTKEQMIDMLYSELC